MANDHVVAGVLLVAGTLLFVIGAAGFSRFRSSGTPTEYLNSLSAHPGTWQVAMRFLLAGVLVTALGFGLLSAVLWNAGDHLFSVIALVSYLLGAPLWAIFQAYRVAVPVGVAAEAASGAAPPPLFAAMQTWAGWLFTVYMTLAYIAIANYGGALLATGVAPPWIGWTSVVLGSAGALSMMIGGWPRIGGMSLIESPIWIQVTPLLVGIFLLLHP
jgi:hypothetical protein